MSLYQIKRLNELLFSFIDKQQTKGTAYVTLLDLYIRFFLQVEILSYKIHNVV